MKKNILKKFAIVIASTSLALTAPVMSDASVFGTIQTVEAATEKVVIDEEKSWFEKIADWIFQK